MDNLSQWLLTHYGKEQFTPGPERMALALMPLKHKFKDSRIVTIAGTNGKGETTLRLSQYLHEHSHCTWTSPHIERITERFRSEEGEISLDELEALIQACHEYALAHSFKLSYYEFLFFVFCTWASEKSPEFLLLEVGLGGRLDAVNFFDAEVVLLPSVSRDHQEILGNRYDLILKEKLGVLRPGSLLISFLDLFYLRERTRTQAHAIGARLIDLADKSKIPGENFSHRNQFLAYAAYLSLTGQAVNYENWNPEENSLEHRGEVVAGRALWTLFGSHNVDGMRKLIQFLSSEIYNSSRPSFDAVIVAFSQRPPNDLVVMLKMIKASGFKNVKVTCFKHPKAASREMMEGLVRKEGLEFVDDIDSYVQGTNSGKVLVTGSYYFLGYIKSILRC